MFVFTQGVYMPTPEEAYDFFTRIWEPEEEEPVEKADTEVKEKDKKKKKEGEEGEEEEPEEGEEKPDEEKEEGEEGEVSLHCVQSQVSSSIYNSLLQSRLL